MTLVPRISTTVFALPSVRLSRSRPDGHSGADTRSRAYAENSAPNSMTSDAMNSHMPSVTLVTPVSARRSTV